MLKGSLFTVQGQPVGQSKLFCSGEIMVIADRSPFNEKAPYAPSVSELYVEAPGAIFTKL